MKKLLGSRTSILILGVIAFLALVYLAASLGNIEFSSARTFDFERDELAAHHVEFEEAIECFFSDFEIRRNKSYRDRYQLIGNTIDGRRLKIIFQLKPGNVVRIITGWQV